ncbi:importin-4-like [Anomalospiza imberbis]|uniref:importin-4-like n=1 Tax=Anomalospiza imberbis TaxID=187417 RepID=UPI00358E5B4B
MTPKQTEVLRDGRRAAKPRPLLAALCLISAFSCCSQNGRPHLFQNGGARNGAAPDGTPGARQRQDPPGHGAAAGGAGGAGGARRPRGAAEGGGEAADPTFGRRSAPETPPETPPELIDRLPHVLVEALERETDSSSRGALATLGARLLLLGGPKCWEPVEKWIQEAARDPQKMEGALRCLGVAVGVAGPALSGRGPALLGLCRGRLRARADPGSLGAALGALGALVALGGARKTDLLRSLVPDVLGALQELLALDEDRGADALEVLDEFLEANPESLTPHLRPLLELCLQVNFGS